MADTDMFEAALYMAARECGEEEVDFYMQLPLLPHTFSKRHVSRMQGIFRRERHKDWFSGIHVYVKRVAVVFLVICTTLFASIISIEAVREDIWETVVAFFDTYFLVGKDDPHEQVFLDTYYSPTWLPEGYTEMDRAMGKESQDIIYMSDTDDLIVFQHFMYEKADIKYDIEDAIWEDVQIHDCHGKFITYSEDKADNVLVWYDDENAFSITAPLPREVMIQIAESVR